VPEIDVTDVLIGSDIAATGFTVVRRLEIVNNFGESTVQTITLPATGSIQPSGEQGLMREEGYDAQAKSVKVITTFRLRGVSRSVAGTRYKPDLVFWNGDYYEVKSLEDYSQFGGGLVEAECTSIDYVDLPPAELPPYAARLDFSKPNNSAWIGSLRRC